jgi:hypothetical protein
MKKSTFALIFALVAIAVIVVPVFASGLIPVTGISLVSDSAVVTGDVAKVSMPKVFDYGVVQQPKNNPAYVSEENGKLTQFGMTAQYGSLGLLAHNYLAGAPFGKLKVGDVIYVTYTDGSAKAFKIDEVRRYQALTPSSPYSKFIDLQSNKTMTASDVFYSTYGVKGRLVMQTCIYENNDPSWGRLFIIATPYDAALNTAN